MKRIVRGLVPVLLLAVLVAWLAACTLQAPVPRPVGMVREGGRAQAVAPAPAAVPAYGYLRLLIRWPERDLAGFRGAAIPDSTNAIAVRIAKGETALHEEVLARTVGSPVASAFIRLKQADNLTVTARAYASGNPDPARDIPIAQGSANFNILASQVTRATLVLDALFAPMIQGLSTIVGQPGDQVTISGVNLGVVAGATPSVTFCGTAASVSAPVTPVSSTSLLFTIPPGAAIGRVVVTDDGIPSLSNFVLWVARDLTLDAPRQTWDNGPANQRMVYYGKTLQFAATPGWNLAPGTTLAQFGAAPAVTWLSSALRQDGNSVDQAGVFTASLVNAATTISATLGSLVSSGIAALPVGVDGVNLDTGSLTLNALPPTGSPDARYASAVAATVQATVTTTLPFNGGVAWSSSDTSRATVSAGRVSTVANASAGTAIVTATAIDYPYLTATASVTVTRKGSLVLGVK